MKGHNLQCNVVDIPQYATCRSNSVNFLKYEPQFVQAEKTLKRVIKCITLTVSEYLFDDQLTCGNVTMRSFLMSIKAHLRKCCITTLIASELFLAINNHIYVAYYCIVMLMELTTFYALIHQNRRTIATIRF